jgi:ADP-ribose 1''-phosphate phosphatase
MALKRSSPEADSSRLHKQTRLNFGQKMASQKTSTTKQPSKAAARASDRASQQESNSSAPSKDAITSARPPKAKHGFIVIEKVGDIFDAPDDTVIIHACNCVGSWGAGIAAAFRTRYPKAFEIYKDHCKTYNPDQLIQRALLIPPKDSKQKHWVGCLFSSKRYGRGKDSPQQILDATAPSMLDLVEQMSEAGEEIREIRICQINSGLFAVPWEHSRAVIESLELDEELKIPKEIVVYSLPTN